MSQRSAPKAGYDTPGKSDYRETVWKRIRASSLVPLSCASVLLMPSVEAIEIDVAEQFGVLRKNIFAVDRNPAIAATITRKRPGLRRSMGCDIGVAFQRLAESSENIDIANLDFTGTIETVAPAVEQLAGLGVLRPDGVVSITVLKGREGAAVHRDLELMDSADVLGFENLVASVNLHSRHRGARYVDELRHRRRARDVFDLSSGDISRYRNVAISSVTGWTPIGSPFTYVSGHAPMLVSLFRVKKRRPWKPVAA